MIAGYYFDQKPIVVKKVPNFYLPNKEIFLSSVGSDFENRLSSNKSINDEILIFAHFCEIVGPVPLVVYPKKCNLSVEIIDMIVLKAMSVDYQSCERGETVSDATTHALMLDCSIPFFVVYFTLWDIYARGFVRPCCIIVCCRDKIRARELFVTKYLEISQKLKPLLNENIKYFYQELETNKEMIDRILLLDTSDKVFEGKECNRNHLIHLSEEYALLISKINDNEHFEPWEKTTCDFLLDINIAENKIKRELRPIYHIMKMSEAKTFELLISISKIFTNTVVSESFCLSESDFNKEMSYSLQSSSQTHNLKCNVKYFNTAFAMDKSFLNTDKSLPLCLCRTLLDNMSSGGQSTDLGNVKEIIFPNLVNIKVSQCPYISYQVKTLGLSNIIKLVFCLFSQSHIVIFVDEQKAYTPLMNFLLFFLPVPYYNNYITHKIEWPTFEQLKECPITFLSKDSRSSEIPLELHGFINVYDYTTNQFMIEPKYSKGHIMNFFESFKHLDYNHLHLEPLVNILLLNYVDMIYQWTTVIGRRDRRWITEDYLIKLGYSHEDIVISERITLYILQVLSKSKQKGEETNSFLTSSTIFSTNIRKDSK